MVSSISSCLNQPREQQTSMGSGSWWLPSSNHVHSRQSPPQYHQAWQGEKPETTKGTRSSSDSSSALILFSLLNRFSNLIRIRFVMVSSISSCLNQPREQQTSMGSGSWWLPSSNHVHSRQSPPQYHQAWQGEKPETTKGTRSSSDSSSALILFSLLNRFSNLIRIRFVMVSTISSCLNQPRDQQTSVVTGS